ncbi:MAG TPA: hypothetical protein VIF09_17450 [Polyangiaceae bacterium]
MLVPSKARFLCYLAAMAGCIALTGACDDRASTRKVAPPMPVASVVAKLGIDAGELEAVVDPPAPVGDFRAELTAFTTVDACVAQRGAMDPVVGDALEAIGYDTLVRDACRMLDAAHAQDSKRCSGIDASSLRERCEALVAELSGDADACPFDIPTRPESGRDPVCIAVAAHDARFCAAAVGPLDRATCEATFALDDGPCKRLVLRADEARCSRDEKRFATAFPVSATAHGAPLVAEGKASAGGDAFGVDLARGVVVVDRMDGAHVILGSVAEGAASLIARSPDTTGSIGAELVVPIDLKRAWLERITVEQPGKPPASVDGSAARAFTVAVRTFEKRRGGPVEVTVDARGDAGTGIHLEARTFVRDVVSSKDLYGASLGVGVRSRFGDAGTLR